MNHELLSYHYRARHLKLTDYWQQNEQSLLDNSNSLRSQLTALHTLLVSQPVLIPSVLDRLFSSPEQQVEDLSQAITYHIQANFVKFLFQKLIQIAATPNTQTIDLDQNLDFQRFIPRYYLFFSDTEMLAQITLTAMHQASDILLQSIHTQTLIFNPRRDIALMMYPTQVAINPGETIISVPSNVEGVGLKLVYPQGSNFANRSVYIHTLEDSPSSDL